MIPLLARLFCILLSLRYRVHTDGEELLDTKAPLLLLPNHQALVDPQILIANVLQHRKVAPIVTETFFRMPMIRYLFRMLGAVEMPLRVTAEQLIDYRAIEGSVIDVLKEGRCIVLYPSGQLCKQGYEVILGKQSAYRITKQLPENVRIVGVRIRGLWGSMWSTAWSGRTPPLVSTYCKAIAYVLLNGIFFCPRRDVSIALRDLTEDLKKRSEGSLREFNSFLEHFYNAPGEEQVRFLKHVFYGPALKRSLPEMIEGSIAELADTRTVSADDVSADVLAFVKQTLHDVKGDVSPDAVTLATHLVLDLHFDSLALAEAVSIIRAEYKNTSSPPLSHLKTVTDLCLMAQGMFEDIQPLPPCTFNAMTFQPTPIEVDPNQSIVDHVLTTVREHPTAPFCYDALQGTTTRKEFLTKAIVASRILKRIAPEARIGIMLPALQSTSLLILAAYLAGKTPVMFNWTVGKRAMQHCMEMVNVSRIVTIRSFFETAKDQIPHVFHDRFVFVEEEIEKLSWGTKLMGLLRTKCAVGSFGFKRTPDIAVVRSSAPRPTGPSSGRALGMTCSPCAVILFSSGSEALPKAVPLTERNILTDLKGTLEIFPIGQNEKVLSFLPPFHSFGFTVTTILPLLGGVRIAYTPDPSDAQAILRMIRHTQPTLLASTPTFLKLLLNAAKSGDLHSMNTVVTGAEALTEEVRMLFEKKAQPGAKLLEGYGITECSPVVTINPPERTKVGSVGKVLPHLHLTIFNLEKAAPTQPNEQGMIYVRGDSVFSGYLGASVPSPFEIIDGVTYYKTGDLGYLDDEGYLYLTGRLKRFLKIGGEMISLPAIEALLNEQFGEEKQHVLAVEGSDTIDPPRIVLFTKKPIDLTEANSYLRARGASDLMRIDAVEVIDAIPLLGSGKIDYKVLRDRILTSFHDTPHP